ncbi:hypothetical protein KSP35_19840 [Aquihabitans sp. G128]|uniref:hypothetical protein n=1 Tax=Aquihabitans sp. G128 TaxID=2849779 RepID=UPI001C23D986|nr:hypothetical protein [Aquihabitans sp. G128]QXC60548.1 hypothetical protein KSP35_19840 [Aquihabitans sp. G128]
MTDQRTKADALAAFLSLENKDDAAPLSAAELNQFALASLSQGGAPSDWHERRVVSPGVPRLDLRLHGKAIDGHSAPVRLATRALTIVQDLVSVVGMAHRNKKSLSGAIPKDILQATELNLNPAATPGSLIFELRGNLAPINGDEIPGADPGVTLADLAAADIFRLLDAADSGDDGLMLDLQRLGPRVATHFRRLCALTLSESLLLDMRWQQGNGAMIFGQLAEASAGEMERVITKSKFTSERITLRGHMITISTEDKLVLRDQSGNRVRLVEAESFDQDPANFYDKDVVAEVDLEVEEHPTTGRDRPVHHLVRLTLDDGSSTPRPEQLSI